ncbi:hypothetical protein DdX_19814 [Ditylenchus destructor]|uniref:Uncharacterized protein n=1 Tax=Ditylenchus destructor TaxID=166010 RepID=A0AAD4QTZ9_9BILA|nr:hypothetical protein DdX_19814 [Ditylenchus destructor]
MYHLEGKGKSCTDNRQCSGKYRCFTDPGRLLVEERGPVLSRCGLSRKNEAPVYGVDSSDRTPWTEDKVMEHYRENGRFPKPGKYLDRNYIERHLEKFKNDPRGVSFLYPARYICPLFGDYFYSNLLNLDFGWFDEWRRDVQDQWRWKKRSYEQFRREAAEEGLWNGLLTPEQDDSWKYQFALKGLPQGDNNNPFGGVVVLPASEMDKVINKHVHQNGHLRGLPRSHDDFQKLKRIMGRTDSDSEIKTGKNPHDPGADRDAAYVRLDVSLKYSSTDDWLTGLRMTDGNEQVYDQRQFKPGGYTKEGGYPQATIGPFIPPPRVQANPIYVKPPRPHN